MLKYRKNYKYQLAEDVTWMTGILPKESCVLPRVLLETNGALFVAEGYAWDGCSGPVIDRKRNMRAGAVHDALYLLMRAGLLPHRYWPQADAEFARVLLDAGNAEWLVNIYVKGLAWANGKHAHPDNRKRVYENSY